MNLLTLTSLNLARPTGGGGWVGGPIIPSGILNAPLKTNLLNTIDNRYSDFARESIATIVNFEGGTEKVNIGEARFEGVRRVENLVSSPELPTTQNITVGVGSEYNVRIGATSDNLATVTFSGAFSGVLTADNTNEISFPNGTPKTATTTTLTCTISGNIRNFQVEKVIGQANQNPSEFTLPQRQTKKLKLDGVDDYIRADNIPLDGSFSYSVRAKSDSANWNDFGFLGGYGVHDDIAQPNTWLLHSNLGATTVSLIIYDGAVRTIDTFTPTEAITEENQYGFTFNASTGDYVLYFNGASIKSGNTVYGRTSDTMTFELGREINIARFFAGVLEDCRLWNGVLDPSEMLSVNSGNTVDESNLVFSWALDEIEGEVAFDTSTNSNNGVLLGFDFFAKNYETENGNTVDGSGVVAEAVGADIPEYKKQGILIEEQGTSLLTYSDDITNPSWTKGVNIVADNHNTLRSTDPTSTRRSIHGFSATIGKYYTFSFYGTLISGSGTAKIGIDLGGTTNKDIVITGTKTRYDITVLCSSTANRYVEIYQAPLSTIGVEHMDIKESKILTSYVPTTSSTVTRLPDDLTYEYGAGNFPQKFSFLAELRPVADGADYEDTDFRIFGTEDSRGAANEVRTFGDTIYDFTLSGGGNYAFRLKQSDFSKDIKTKLGFSLKQEGANIRAIIIKDGVVKLNTTVAGTLDHSNSGKIYIGSWNANYFSSNYKYVNLHPAALSVEDLQDQMKEYDFDEFGNFEIDEFGNRSFTYI